MAKRRLLGTYLTGRRQALLEAPGWAHGAMLADTWISSSFEHAEIVGRIVQVYKVYKPDFLFILLTFKFATRSQVFRI
jgi:hypothetical protein